jgi:Acyltransferase family
METATMKAPRPVRQSSAKDVLPTKDSLLTVLRSLALVVVVVWHGALSTLRWDGHGPHAGNALHLVPGGFVLTWFLQVMPLFFLVGGAVSLGSLRRNAARGGSSLQWVVARLAKLLVPAIPLVAIGGLVVAFASPATVGLVKLALSLVRWQWRSHRRPRLGWSSLRFRRCGFLVCTPRSRFWRQRCIECMRALGIVH